MNPLTNMKNVKKLSEAELKGRNKTSWHDQYRGSAWIFVGGLPFDLTEGDILCVFSQYGEPVNINLVRDKDSGKSKGFCFICFEDQRSTDLTVDNLNGIKLLGRTLRVDHVNDYKPPKERKEDDDVTRQLKRDGLSAVSAEREPIKIKEEMTHRRKIKEEVTHRKKIKKERLSSESDSDDSPNKKSKTKKKRRRKQKESSSSSSESSSESETESESEEEVKRRKKEKRRAKSTDTEDEVYKKKQKRGKHHETDKAKKTKNAKSIEDLKREAQLIQEELERRQLAKAKEEMMANMAKEKEKRSKVSKHPRDDYQNEHCRSGSPTVNKSSDRGRNGPERKGGKNEEDRPPRSYDRRYDEKQRYKERRSRSRSRDRNHREHRDPHKNRSRHRSNSPHRRC